MQLIIYLIALLEWFTTLSVQIVALRKFTPIIWSNSISTSVVIWVILLALSYWYYKWWEISARWKNIEKILVRNLLLASAYYFFLTYIFSEFTLQNILFFSQNYFFSILISTVILFFIPVFLASQTIPLLAELLKGSHSWEKMWKLLFYSTVWSFAGSVVTSSILFPSIWVDKTAAVAPLFLVVCAFLTIFYTKKYSHHTIFIASWLLAVYILHLLAPNYISKNTLYYSSNAYHDIHIYDDSENNRRIFSLDGAFSSGIFLENKKSFFSYIRETENKILELKPKNVLVIWAAGFTLPRDISQYDFIENIDVIDVDSSLKEIAENYFLEEKLSDKINFHAQPARYFLNTIEWKKYDFILVDAYSGKSLPPQVLTKEFFQKLIEVWDTVMLNIIADSMRETNFSKNLFTTIESEFQNVYYKDVNRSIWAKITNFLVTNKKFDDFFENNIENGNLYTDDRYSIESDMFELNQFELNK